VLGIAYQAVEVPKRLAHSLAEVLELADPLGPIGQELIDPLQEDGSADAPAPAAGDLLGLMVGEHGEDKTKLP
jgi:hypothetical protein